MNVHTIPKKIFYSTDLIGGAFFSCFKSFKSYGDLNVLVKVRIVKILSNFKRK